MTDKSRKAQRSLTRRSFLKGLGFAALALASVPAYAIGVEPFRLVIKRYQVSPMRWPKDMPLRIAILADPHICKPWLTVDHLAGIVERANALQPDVFLLLGDYTIHHRWTNGQEPRAKWAAVLSRLEAPLGVHAILGNHDWWEDPQAQRTGSGLTRNGDALMQAGIPVYHNKAVRLQSDHGPFWLAGLGDQIALRPDKSANRPGFVGLHDLRGTLDQVTDKAPLILLAHEPDIFPFVPDRVTLTLSGHTHGGQVRLFGKSLIVPSRYGNRYAYGHIEERALSGVGTRTLIVSGGLGCSIMPVRLGVPPEITLVELGAGHAPSPAVTS